MKILLQNCITILFLVFFSGTTGAQVKTTNRVIRSGAFYRIHYPGNIPVDENGKSLPFFPDSTHLIVLETNVKSAPLIDSINFCGSNCRYTITPIMAEDRILASLKESWEFGRNSYGWLIELNHSSLENHSFKKPFLLRINGKLGKKRFALKIYRETEIQLELAQ